MENHASDLLIILDLDETLIHARTQPLDYPADFIFGDYHIYLRPHFHRFIKFLNTHFEFAIWSSASDTYVEAITKLIGLEGLAQFIWARSRTTLRRNTHSNRMEQSLIAHKDFYYVKRLKKVKKLGHSLEKILMIDDSPHKVLDNYGNALIIKEYLGDQKDREILLLMNYLQKIKAVENLRLVNKRNWQISPD